MKLKKWIQSLIFFEILLGMKETLKHLLKYRPITLEYPHVKKQLPENYRGMLGLLRYDDDTEKCGLAVAVVREIEVRLERLDRKSIAGESVRGRGAVAIVDDLDEAFELSNLFAPEHVSLVVSRPRAHLARVRNAGAVFLGEFSHEVLGDYVAGPSHVMPTGGTARFGSGIGVHSFVKISPVVAVDEAASRALSGAASLIARAEGLTAHAEAAEVRNELLSGRNAGVGSSGGRPVGEGGA